MSAPADQHNTTGQYVPSLHSSTGAVSVSLPGYPLPLDSHVMATLEELPSEFPFNPDMIGGDVLGFGKCLIHPPHHESPPIFVGLSRLDP